MNKPTKMILTAGPSISKKEIDYVLDAGLQDSVQNGKTGFLVDPQNIEMLQDAIRDIINDKEYYKKVSVNALKWSKNFTWEKSVKKSWKVIKDVYEKNK